MDDIIPTSAPDSDVPQAPAPSSVPPGNQPATDNTERLLSALGYIGFLCILPLVLRRDSRFCNYHGKQGLVLAIADMILRIFTFWTGFYTFILILIYAVMIYSAVRAYRGNEFTLPLISDIAKELKI